MKLSVYFSLIVVRRYNCFVFIILVTGRVYVYNKLTKATRWLKTKDGSEVPSNTALNPKNIDDPNPLGADSGGGGEEGAKEVTTSPSISAQPVGAFRPQREKPAPIEEEEEEWTMSE